MSALTLDSPVQYVKGVGPRRAECLAELNIETVRDLLNHLPFRYGAQEAARPISELREGESATIIGTLTDAKAPHRSRRSPIRGLVEDDSGACAVAWFQSPYLANRLQIGDRLRLHGKVSQYQDMFQLVNPHTEWADDSKPTGVGNERFEPVYPATRDITSRQLMRWIRTALPDALESLAEFHPAKFLRERKLPDLPHAYERLHRPVREGDPEAARRRLAYDELLIMQLAITLKREHRRQIARARPIEVTDEVDRRIRKRLVFRFTGAQDRVIRELRADLARPWPMNRLLQGDVGAGKTAMAVYAALATVAARMQTAIMAPTEILARQHAANIEKYLRDSRVQRRLLTGSTPTSERKSIAREIASGAVDLIVGTHALLEKKIAFASLGLVVIDEQHKFGVAQRTTLRRKGLEPHMLTMSATPIPRSLAMTAFGELDVSIIDELPPGRTRVRTRLVLPSQTGSAWAAVREELRAGRQAFVVYPLVEESEVLPLKAATREVERLAKEEMRDFRVALLHGKMKPADKERIMDEFRDGKIQALVSTTVVEVGVDVPNASVMLIQHAERYGLSQLHQLRGRIGRGRHTGQCLLMTDAKSPSALERLRVLVRTPDGFEVAEADLRHRGPGEMLGTRQHGDVGFRVARLPEDADMVETASRDARGIVHEDPQLRSPQRRALRAELLRRHRHNLEWLDAG